MNSKWEGHDKNLMRGVKRYTPNGKQIVLSATLAGKQNFLAQVVLKLARI